MLTLNPDAFAWVDTDGNVVALHLETSRYKSVTGSAIPLWYALVEGTTQDKLVSLLVDRYGITTERAATDVNAFLADLRSYDGLREE